MKPFVRWLAAPTLGCAVMAAHPGFAQQALPSIDIGAASPVKRRAPAPVQAAQIAAPAPRRPAATPSGTSAPAPEAPPRGTLPIVTDQFGTVTVVTNGELRRSTGTTLGDLLFAKPGVTGSSFAPGAASRPIVRGLDNYRVRIQENGVASSGVSELGEDHAVPLDPLGASQVEVVRGPATLRWGSQAIGGVVNVSNNRIPDAPPCSDSVVFRDKGCARFETRAAFATVDLAQEGAALLDAGQGNVLVHADVQGRRANDYAIPGYPYLYPPEPPPVVYGRQPNSAMRSGGASLGATYLFDSGHVGFAVTQFNTQYGIPGVEPAETSTRINMRQTKVSGKGEFRPQSSYVEAIRFWAGLSDYKHHEIANLDGAYGVLQTFTSKELETRVEAQFLPLRIPFATLKSFFGVQGANQILTSPGVEGGLFNPNTTRSVAAFLFNEFRFTDALRMEIAGRVENANVAGSSPNLFVAPDINLTRYRNFAPMSGAIGFLRDLPGDMVASLTAQYVERAPRAPELLSRGPHESTGTFDIGNPDLSIEAAKTVELGLRRAVGPFRFEASVYYTRFDGFIYRNFTGQSCGEDFASCTPGGEGGELAQAVYAQRDAVFRGGEFQSQWDVAPLAGGTVGVENQFDVVRASFTYGGNVPRIPPLRLGGGLFWRDSNWLARVNLLHAFAQNDIAPYETPTSGYNLLKAEVSYRLRLDPNDPKGREMMVGVVGNNLLNDDIRNSVSFRKNEVLMPGANVRFFANIVF